MATAPRSGTARSSSAGDFKNRRAYPRRRHTYPVAYVDNGAGQKPAYGLDIGGGGICLLTQDPIPPAVLDDLELFVMIGDRKVRFVAAGCWAVPMNVRGAVHYRYGLRMKNISDRDWDYIMEHSLDGDGGPRLAPGTMLSHEQRDTILPFEKQHRIAESLASRRRLDYTGQAQIPAVEYTLTGYEMQRGTAFYRLQVRSRMNGPDRSWAEHRSTVLVAIEGETVKVLD
ncbi:MAG: PilZ domain-containing protein [Candidatus Velthaea sp.]